MPNVVRAGPFLHLYFVLGDDGEEYKRTIKKRIKDWVTPVSERRFQEWLIVHVSDSASSKTKPKFNLNLFSVFDKIKSDFNTGKKDRCVQMRLGDPESVAESWDLLVATLKESILSSLSQHVSCLDEDLRKFDSQRHYVGWNYFQLFAVKVI